jgi:DUF1365 family protein
MVQVLQDTWEYQVAEIEEFRSLQDRLRELGHDGWELVSVVRGSGDERQGPAKTLRARRSEAFYLFFKRRATGECAAV